MRRRDFLALLGGLIATWPNRGHRMRRRGFIVGIAVALLADLHIAKAQSAKVPVVGVLVLGALDPEPFFKGLQAELRKLGYVDGETIRLVLKSAEGKADILAVLAAELVRLKVDIIVAQHTPVAMATKRVTSAIPIIMAPAANPVETGLISSLARPGGNVTGLSGVGAELAGKVIELIRELLPSARRVAVLANATDPFTGTMLAQINHAAPAVRLEIRTVMLQPADGLEAAFAALDGQGVDAIFVQPSLLRNNTGPLALKHRLPSFTFHGYLPQNGGLLAYTNSFAEETSLVSLYVERILKGAKPAELPVQQPTKFDLVINLKTAKTLGLMVPPSILLRTTEVIE